MPDQYVPTSHENIKHDSLETYGYDWEHVANPAIQPKFPFKIYLPLTTEDVVQAVKEAKQLGQTLKIRSKGHSSNDLVLEEHGAVLSTQKLDRILRFDPEMRTVQVQSGAVLAHVDDFLAKHGFGLPVIGDHDDITAGGFASVGGIGPASHKYGLFVDNVRELEYVNWDGELIRCSKTANGDEFFRVLTGTGQYGVIATLTLDIIPVDKYGMVLKNRRLVSRSFDEFIERSYKYAKRSDTLVMERGIWFDFGHLAIGQFSVYRKTPQTFLKSLRNRLSFGFLNTLGYWAGRLPDKVDLLLKCIGIIGMIFTPRYATIKNVERYSDQIIDSSVGDPTRMLVLLPPVDQYKTVFRKLYNLCREYRERYHCFTVLTFSVKGIQSPYLSGGDPSKRYCELILYAGINLQGMTDAVLEQLVSDIDDLCIEHGAYRYMHSKTVKDPERRHKIDPNARYAGVTLNLDH